MNFNTRYRPDDNFPCNKINIWGTGGNYGFGIDGGTLDYFTGSTHRWYYGSSGTNFGTVGMTLTNNNLSTSGYIYGGNYVQGGSFYLVSGRQVIYSNSGTSGQGSFEHLNCLHCFFTYAYGLRVIGNFSVDAGYTKNWRIKHPILKDKDLIHTCIEGTRADNLYRGRKQLINGECVVNIDLECNTTGGMTDGTFKLINKNIQVFVNNNETFDKVVGSVVGNKLTIRSDNVNASCFIDWLVIGERNDDEIINNLNTSSTGSVIVEIDREVSQMQENTSSSNSSNVF
jgi:hypothetical protein